MYARKGRGVATRRWAGHTAGVSVPRTPRGDEIPDPPQDWVAIPLGAGQEPNAYGGVGSFQWDPEGTTGQVDFGAFRRNPDETFVLVVRPPERP